MRSKPPFTSRPLQAAVAAAIALAIIAATIAVVLAAHADERSRAERRDAEVASLATQRLASSFERTTFTLYAVRSLVGLDDRIDQGAFERFTRSLIAQDPAVTMVAWNPLVRPDDRAAYEQTGPQIVVPGSRDPLPPSNRPSFPITRVAPFAVGGAHLGADPGSEPIRADALRRARENGTPQLSDRVRLVGGAPGTILAVPVTAATSAVAGAPALRGYVTAVYSLEALEAHVAGGLPEGATVRLSDDGSIPAGVTRFDGGAVGTVMFGGKNWRIVATDPGGTSPALPAAVAIGGLLLAIVVVLSLVLAFRRESDAVAGRATAEGRLEEFRARHESILSAAGEGIVGLDQDGRVTFVNPAAAKMLARRTEDLAGHPLAAVFRSPDRSPAEGAEDPVSAAVRGDRREGELIVRRPDGTSFPVEHTTTPLIEDGERVGAVISFRDITARKRLEAEAARSLAEAEKLAAVDPLTGLANHRTFHERLSAEVERAQRYERDLSLVVLDLDSFKAVNDTHGHQVGDRLLRRVAELMSEQVRAGELLARVGGEEFAVVLPEADEMEAYQVAERMRQAVARSDLPPHGHITISAGVCGLDQAESADRLYQLADGALYWAKQKGRNAVFIYSPEVVGDLNADERAERLARQQARVSIHILARAVDAKDPSTRMHSERVADLAAEIARGLGWATERCTMLREAALVHDVGKIGVPDALLFKPDRLTPDEYLQVQQHASLGAQIVAEALSDEQIAWVRAHHERWDGTGYPDRLKGEQIPEGARIIALADAWDTMTSERPYSLPADEAEALRECVRVSGTQFWPRAVEALVGQREGAVRR